MQGRDALPAVFAVAGDVVSIPFPEADLQPVPGIAGEHLDGCRIRAGADEHVVPVHGRIYISGGRISGDPAPCTRLRGFPVLQVRLIGGDLSDRLRDRRPSEVGRELVEILPEIVRDCFPFGSLYRKGFHGVHFPGLPLTGRNGVPFLHADTDKEVHCPPVDDRRGGQGLPYVSGPADPDRI